jgi:hypothetical protein
VDEGSGKQPGGLKNIIKKGVLEENGWPIKLLYMRVGNEVME